MNIAVRILNVLFPLRCPVCGTLTEGNSPRLCSSCMQRLQKESEMLCPLCGCRAAECLCVPTELPSACTPLNGRVHISAGFYLPGQGNRCLSRLIFALKDKSSDAAARILARMLSSLLMRTLLEAGEDPRTWLLVYPPRSAARKAETGLDHARRLTRLLGKELGAPTANVFRRRGGQEQKTLHEDERFDNIRRTMILRHPEKCRGRKILLIDDVLTSGATLSRCAELLQNAGAESVFCATILKTLPRRQKKRPETGGKFWFEEA